MRSELGRQLELRRKADAAAVRAAAARRDAEEQLLVALSGFCQSEIKTICSYEHRHWDDSLLPGEALSPLSPPAPGRLDMESDAGSEDTGLQAARHEQMYAEEVILRLKMIAWKEFEMI